MSDVSNASHDSSLETTNSPTINLPRFAHDLFADELKPGVMNDNNSNTLSMQQPLAGGMNSFDDLLFRTTTTTTTTTTRTTAATANNPVELFMDLTSPVLEFEHAMNMTPSLNALGLFDMSSPNPNTPHLPPLNIVAADANSQQAVVAAAAAAAAAQPDLDWNTFCNLLQQQQQQQQQALAPPPSPPAPSLPPPVKKRKLMKAEEEEHGDDDDNDDDDRSTSSNSSSSSSSNGSKSSFVGIRTHDGEVRIEIPAKKQESKFTVFGNACSDKIEDILQPKKRTRYVRGLSEEEKKTRRREQNRNAAARSRARKNAMISKVIQLHQENMGLRAFVAQNITQTKLLRDEIDRLNALIVLNQQPDKQAPHTSPSCLLDIINEESTHLFSSKH